MIVSLHDWQEALQASILERRDAMQDLIEPSDIDRTTRLGIYQDAYLLRLAEALGTNYPCVRDTLGDDDFGHLVIAYQRFRTPRHASIRWFGDCLADFLCSAEPYQSVPILADLARFEWSLRHTIDAADAVRLEHAHLAAVPAVDWPELVLALHPSVTLLRLDWNAPAVWQAFDDETATPNPARAPSAWLVYRGREGTSNWQSIPDLEFAALEAIRSREPFADLCVRLETHGTDPDKVPVIASQMLQEWIAAGILTRGG
jgi:hypothetical protein